MKRIARTSCCFLNNIKENKAKDKLIFTSLVQAKPYLRLGEITKGTIFKNLYNSQQKRGYALKGSTNCRECWNCKKEHRNTDVLMLCEYCGFLQDITDVNYFQLLDFPQKFDLEAQALTKHFRQLQTIVHPDKFSNKNSREQSNSANWSSLINKAYKTLLTPLDRGQYLLELNGLGMPQDNSALDTKFLMEMMERNEEVEDAITRNELNAINERLTEELKTKEEFLSKCFSENNLKLSQKILIEMKYLVSIQKTIKGKLQTLLAD